MGISRALSLILAGSGIWKWALGLGAPGLILVGLIDNSVIPIPGGMDIFVILLTAHHRQWWAYYALFATAGAVIGGYVTFRLAKKGGKESLERKIGKRRAEKVYQKFKKGGFSTIAIGSVLPPPFPLVPVLMAAAFASSSAQSTRHPKISQPTADRPKTSAPDLLQHYNTARTFGIGGDAARAASEYRLFLSEALGRIVHSRHHRRGSRCRPPPSDGRLSHFSGNSDQYRAPFESGKGLDPSPCAGGYGCA